MNMYSMPSELITSVMKSPPLDVWLTGSPDGGRRLGRDLPADPGSAGFGFLKRRGRHRIGGDRRRHRGGGADKTCTFEEITAIGVSRLTAFRHRILPENGH